MAGNNGKRNSLLIPGQTFRQYTVERLLGHGGMGEVWLARHNALGSYFALKLLFPEVANRNKTSVERFKREARLAARIKHDNLITVHDAGDGTVNDKDGRSIVVNYIAMDYLSGGNLAEK